MGYFLLEWPKVIRGAQHADPTLVHTIPKPLGKLSKNTECGYNLIILVRPTQWIPRCFWDLIENKYRLEHLNCVGVLW